MTSKSLHCGVLRDEADVSVIAGVESTEGDVFERIKIVDTWSALGLLLKVEFRLQNVAF